MFEIRKTLKYLTLASLFISTTVFAKDPYSIEKQIFEVITNLDGSELIFKASGIKPEIMLEDHVKITNENNALEKIDYIKKLPNSMYFIEFDNSKRIWASYSKDGKIFHEKLNREEDRFIKITINDVEPNDSMILKIRYEHNLFGLRE